MNIVMFLFNFRVTGQQTCWTALVSGALRSFTSAVSQQIILSTVCFLYYLLSKLR